jgi:hypothetical protein
MKTTSSTHKPILLFAILVTIGGYFYIALPECMERYAMCFQSIAPAPFRYRILSVIFERLISPDGLPHMILLADIVIHFVCVVIVYLALWRWLRRWLSAQTAIIGVLLTACVWMFSYNFYLRTTHTVLELMFVVIALLLIRGRIFWYSVAVALASLNKETAFFLVLMWMAFNFNQWKLVEYWAKSITLAMVYVAVTVALHVSIGEADHILGLEGTIKYNLGDLRDSMLINIILSPLWYMMARGFKSSPPHLRALALVGVLHLVAIVIGAAWNESPRLILPLLPLILPTMLYTDNPKSINTPV